MTTSQLILLAAALGAMFGASAVVCFMRAGLTVDNAPVPTEEQLQVRHDCNAQTMAHILGDDLPTPLPVTKFNDLAYRQHIADAQARIEASNVVPMPGLRVVQQRDGGAS